MRRNLTISFDDDFIKFLEKSRGGFARGRYIEAALRGPGGRDVQVAKAAREVLMPEPPTPKATRSPEPDFEPPPGSPAAEALKEIETEPVWKAPKHKHSPKCDCKVCKP
jgi:hypothetical protein